MSATDPTAPIGPRTRIVDAIRWRVGADRVLLEEFGLPCYRCEARHVESLAEGVAYCGLDPRRVAARLDALPAYPADEDLPG